MANNIGEDSQYKSHDNDYYRNEPSNSTNNPNRIVLY